MLQILHMKRMKKGNKLILYKDTTLKLCLV